MAALYAMAAVWSPFVAGGVLVVAVVALLAGIARSDREPAGS
jgi:hypothetical protein